MTLRLVQYACAAAMLLVSISGAHAAINLNDPIPVEPRVQTGKLANGLTYYIQKNARPEKRLELRLVVKAGSILEDDDQQGLAHFVEHMGFNGSKHFKKNDLIAYLQSVGVKFGPDLNASTSFDETIYILPIPTDKKENVALGFQVLEDWAHGLTLDADAIDLERGVLIEELRNRKGAQDRMSRATLPKLFNGSRYAERHPAGKEDVIKNAPYEAVRRFYKDWYRPDLMAVVVVGDIEPAAAEALIKAHFAGLKNPVKARPRTYAPIPPRTEVDALVVTDKEASINSLMLRYPVREKLRSNTLADYQAMLVKNLFSVMLNQRLQELAQLPEPPFVRAASGLGNLGKGYEAFFSQATPGKGGAGPAIHALIQENARVRRYGFSASELSYGKKLLVRGVEKAYSERDKTDSGRYVAEYMRAFLDGESIPGIENEYNYVREMLPALTLDDVNRYARATIPSDAAKLVTFTGADNADAPAPTQPSLLAALAAAEAAPVKPREEKLYAESLMARPPAAGTIVAEAEDKALGLTRLTLSNGVKVILKPTDFKNDEVVMRGVRYGGRTLFGQDDVITARYAAGVVSSMGLASHAPSDLRQILAGKTVSVSVTMSDHTEHVTGNAGRADVEALLQYVHLRLTASRRDEGLYKTYLGAVKEGVRNALSRPEAVLFETLKTTLYNDHPYVPKTPRPEDLEKLGLDRSITLYKERFMSAKDMTFIFVGSFDTAAVKPLLATYLGSLPTPDIPVAFKDVGIRPVTGVVKKEVRRGIEDKSLIALSFTGQATYSNTERLRLKTLIEVLKLRVTDVLREKQALIYTSQLNGTLSHVPYGHYEIDAFLPTAPDKVDKVLAALFAEIELLKNNGPDIGDLNKVKQNTLQATQRGMRENGVWASWLESSVFTGADIAVLLAQDKDVDAFTVADLKAAARRYFKTDNYVQVVLYPEK